MVRSCSGIVLAAKSPEKSYPHFFWRTRIAFLWFTLFHESLGWTLCFPIFLGVPRALGECDGASIFQNSPSYRLARRVIWGLATQLKRPLQQRNRSLPTTFLRLSSGLPFSISASDQTYVAECAARFRLVPLTNKRMPLITRRIRTLFSLSFQKDLPNRDQNLSKVFFHQSVCVRALG